MGKILKLWILWEWAGKFFSSEIFHLIQMKYFFRLLKIV